MGLLKSIEYFDPMKGIQFQTYAVRCIDNEILMFLRANSKYKNTISLDKEIEAICGSLIFKLEEVIPDERVNIALNYEQKERNKIIRQILNHYQLEKNM